MRRPQSLAEVAETGSRSPDRFWTALDEFLDTFYLDHSDRPAQSARLAEIPRVVGDPLLDAWVGAVGEHLADRWLLPVPAWTRRPAHFRLPRPQYVPATPALREFLFESSPLAFRSRLIFTVREPLRRARFPRDDARMGPFPSRLAPALA